MNKKFVQWSHETVYEFPLDYGGSSVPHTGGPAIGLAAHHAAVWTAPISGFSGRECQQKVKRFSSDERENMLIQAGYSAPCIRKFVALTLQVLRSRRFNSKKAEAKRKQKRKPQEIIWDTRTEFDEDLNAIRDLWTSHRVSAVSKKRSQDAVIEIYDDEFVPTTKLAKIDRLLLLYDLVALDSASSSLLLI
jgi:hypothetical protein